MKNLQNFKTKTMELIKNHSLIKQNEYLVWFSQGKQTAFQLQDFIKQYSVLSNQLIIALVEKMINSATLEKMRETKEILVNELGVIYVKDTIEGGTFKFKAGHYEWLYKTASDLGLNFSEVGTRAVASSATRKFCDIMIKLYGQGSEMESQGANYSFEIWRGLGFWQNIIDGFNKYNQLNGTRITYSFFTRHLQLETIHSQHVEHELEEIYRQDNFNEEQFLSSAQQMLNAVKIFWNGLFMNKDKLN